MNSDPEKSEICFIQAGGTIDKTYLATPDDHGRNFEIGDPAFFSIAKRWKIQYRVSYSKACFKDSLEMDDHDRNKIRDAVTQAQEQKVIVTHGTDTIRETAKLLSTIKSGKVVVLTGALDPERFRESDADFNLGMAVGAAHCLPPGIYIALYGEVKKWDEYVHR